MTESLKVKIETGYRSCYGNEVISRIHDLAVEYYGESRVDMRGFMTRKIYSQLLIMPIDDLFRAIQIDPAYKRAELNKIIEKLKEGDKSINSLHDLSLMNEPVFDLLFDNIRGNFPRYYSGDGALTIHYPEVIIENEQGEKHTIKDLYIKTPITSSGRLRDGGFEMNRATMTEAEKRAGYIHSHRPTLSTSQLPTWHRTCLGSGPINDTLHKLTDRSFDEDIWTLYLFELDKYVHTESLSGGPYIKMREISTRSSGNTVRNFVYNNFIFNGYQKLQQVLSSTLSGTSSDRDRCIEILEAYIPYLIDSNVIKYRYVDGKYDIAMSFPEFCMAISNNFIEFSNIYISQFNSTTDKIMIKSLIMTILLKKSTLTQYSVTEIRENNSSGGGGFAGLDGRELFKFKNKMVTFKLESGEVQVDSSLTSRILAVPIISFIYNKLMFYINYNYGNSNSTIASEGGIKAL